MHGPFQTFGPGINDEHKIASLGLGAPLLRPSCDLGWTLCFAPIKM